MEIGLKISVTSEMCVIEKVTCTVKVTGEWRDDGDRDRDRRRGMRCRQSRLEEIRATLEKKKKGNNFSFV